ncbi:hypothetical protein FQZ97_1039260 [compost metagenome]
MSSATNTDAIGILEMPLDEVIAKYSLEELSSQLLPLLPENVAYEGFKDWGEFDRLRDIFRFFTRHNISLNQEYFISEQAEAIYALTELDGVHQQKALGIVPAHYKNKAKAKEWWRKYSSLLYPDRCHHVNATKATAELNRLHEEMKKNGR